MSTTVSFRRLVTRVRNAGEIHFATVDDFGALLPYAWAGLDDDRVRRLIKKSIDVNRLAYPRGKALVIDLIPDAPPAAQVATAVRGSQWLQDAVDRAFASLRRTIDETVAGRLKLPIRQAIAHLDLFHPIVVVDTPIPTTRLERRYIAGGFDWIDLMSEVTFRRLERRTIQPHQERRRLSLAHQ